VFDAFDAFEDMLEPRPKISSQFEYWLTSTSCMSTDFIAQQIQIRDMVRDCCWSSIKMGNKGSRGRGDAQDAPPPPQAGRLMLAEALSDDVEENDGGGIGLKDTGELDSVPPRSLPNKIFPHSDA
jgi:hypothetical protein